MYQYLDIDNAVALATLEDGSTIEISMTDMLTAQFAEAVGIDMAQASEILETGDFSKIQPDKQKVNNLGVSISYYFQFRSFSLKAHS